MRLPDKEFFDCIDDDFEFFDYLESKGYFILNEVIEELNFKYKDLKLKYSTFYTRIQHWQKNDYIISVSIITLGGPRFKYILSEKARKILDKYRKKN